MKGSIIVRATSTTYFSGPQGSDENFRHFEEVPKQHILNITFLAY